MPEPSYLNRPPLTDSALISCAGSSKENLELEDQSEDSGWMSSLEMIGDSEGRVSEGLEGEVRQEVIRVNSGGSSRSSSESLE